MASTADAVRVEVTDRHDGVPLLGRPSPVDGLSGRGLLLVEALASAWGVTPASAGKVVWFEVPHYGSSAA